MTLRKVILNSMMARIAAATLVGTGLLFGHTAVSESTATLVPTSDFEPQFQFLTNETGDGFGLEVGISGDTAVVSANHGLFVFVRSGMTWQQQAFLVPSDGMSAAFPPTLGISGDTIILGGARATVGGNSNQGAVYVFTRNGTTWSETQRLTADDGATGDGFGQAVAIDGDTLIVSATQGDSPQAVNEGTGYIFTREGGTWLHQQKIRAADGAPNKSFGWRVALKGNTAAVSNLPFPSDGAIGRVYVFTRNGSSWAQVADLSVCEMANEPSVRCNFGRAALAVSDDLLIVGNWTLKVGSAESQGVAYIFARENTSWVQKYRFTTSQDKPFATFGTDASISEDTVLISAGGDFPNIPGSVYVYSRSGTDLTFKQNVFINETAVRDRFGASVELSGDSMLVGSPYWKFGEKVTGSAFLYDRRPEPDAVPVSGRVVSSTGRGLGNAIVSMTGPEGFSRTVTTNALGFYSFSEVPAGRTYTVSVRSKRFRFNQRDITVASELSNVDFTGVE